VSKAQIYESLYIHITY